MSSKADEKAALAATEIPKLLVDEKQGKRYERLRFFGKVISFN